MINTGFATRCNNDHVIAADGKQIAISHGTKEDGKSRIYTLPMQGGTPRLITPIAPSYLHGWSPDGRQLAYCADRKGNYDIYVIPVEGGEERQLTTAEGLDDGPEYSPCGEYIWFNSVRTGLMQVWRMKKDGSEQTQMTFDETRNSWFPHVSPDGKSVIFITYYKGDLEPGQHLPNKNVELRIMPATGGKPKTLVKLLRKFVVYLFSDRAGTAFQHMQKGGRLAVYVGNKMLGAFGQIEHARQLDDLQRSPRGVGILSG